MPQERIVITGIGVISPLGKTIENFFANLVQGKSAFKEVSLFDVSPSRSRQAAEISMFDPKEYLDQKGLRYWDRVSMLAASAAKLTLEDAGVEKNFPATELGVVLGSTYGSIGSISAFDTIALKEGPNYVSPMEFPNTVINGPAGRVSIFINAKGVNSTLSTGETSGLDAISYAVDFLRMNRVKGIVAGGVAALTPEVFWGFYKSQALSGSKEGEQELCAPFDRRRNGIILGEGAMLFFLEREDVARQRHAKIYGAVRGVCSLFNSRGNKDPNDSATAERTIAGALQEAGLTRNEISYVAAAANSSRHLDAMESALIKKIFTPHHPPISAVKSMIGECLDASGPFQVAAGLMAMQKGLIPPTINYKEPDPACPVDGVCDTCREAKVEHVLVHSYGCAGHCTALVLSEATN